MRSQVYIKHFFGSIARYKTALLLGFLMASMSLNAQFNFNNNFRGNQPANVIVGADPESENSDLPYFTSGIDDPIGAGWLRLTKAEEKQNGYMYYDRSFPSSMGVVVEFEYKMWRQFNNDTSPFWGFGGDGFTFFLFDATVPEFGFGAFGGSLGYAQRYNALNHDDHPGLTGGYIGVGFDMFGYYATEEEGKIGGLPADPIDVVGRIPNTVSMRGITTNDLEFTSNAFLAGVKLGDRSLPANEQVAQPDLLGYPSTIPTRPTDNQMYRRVRIIINPVAAGGYDVSVGWKKLNDESGTYETLFTHRYEEVPPAFLKMGFAGASNSAINNHEIRSLQVTTPNNLRIIKYADKDFLYTVPGTSTPPANQVSYLIEVINDTDSPYTDAAFLDELFDNNGVPVGTDMFQINSITPTGFIDANLIQEPGTNIVSGTVSIAANTTAFVRVTGDLTGVPVGNRLVNHVSVLPTGSDTDFDLANNYASLTLPVMAQGVDLNLIKVSEDEICPEIGDGNSFSLLVANMGSDAATYRRVGSVGNRIVVMKEVPTGFDYDDSATSMVDNTFSSGSERWYKTTQNIPNGYSGYGGVEFPDGGTRHVYIARYPTGVLSDQTLEANGAVYEHDYPIQYTITPPPGVESYTDVAYVEYRQASSISGWDGSNIEPVANMANNLSSELVTKVTTAPTVDDDYIVYYVGDVATPLEAEAALGYSLVWYLTPDGLPLTVAPTPFTFEPGITTYYVRQTNGICESEMASITVEVRDISDLITNPMIRQRVK